MIENLADLAAQLGCSPDPDSVAKKVYKDTRCGAVFTQDTEGVQVAGYVEGYDGDLEMHFLYYPFSLNDFWIELDACDEDADRVAEELEERTALDDMRECLDAQGG